MLIYIIPKKDKNGIPIVGAEFSVFELDSLNSDNEIIFIQTGTDVNLYEAILDDYNSYNNLSIEISERYSCYLIDSIINTSEVGYFPYIIKDRDNIIKEGICFVSDDTNQTNGTFTRINVKNIFKGYSENTEINTINKLEKGKRYYLCETEPSKGYTYVNNPCTLIDTSKYDNEVFNFVNDSRVYSLKLMKQSPYEVLLDGAKFKITYLDNNEYKNIYLTTGYLNIQREGAYKYLIYKHENDTEAEIVKFNDSYYSTNQVKSGKYYYYQANDDYIDYSLLNDDYVLVCKGGFNIDNLPYSSSLTIEELEAPKGFMITEAIYHLSPNIKYSEITFRNYRVNEFNIIAKKNFKVPKTCIEN